MVGLRPFKSKSEILPEQTLGRGLRRMFRGQPVAEKVSVIGTEAFIEFVEKIKVEGVELEYAAMGGRTPPKSPLLVEVDRDNPRKNIAELDIELPMLSPRIYQEYKNLAQHRLPHRIPDRGRRHRQRLPGLSREGNRDQPLGHRDQRS